MRIFILIFSALFFFNLSASKFRVISTLPSYTEAMYFLEAQDLLVGVSDYCNYPAEAKKLPRFGSSFEINLEKVVKEKVDTVLLAEVQGSRIKGNLQKIGVRTIIAPYKKIEDAPAMLRLFNKAFKLNKDTTINQLEKQIHELLRPITKNKKVLMLIGDKFKNGHLHEVRAIGNDNYFHEILTKLGATNVISQKGYPLIELEGLLKLKYDLIIRISDRNIPSSNDWRKSPFKDKIYLYEKDYAVVLGPRTLKLIKDFRKILK